MKRTSIKDYSYPLEDIFELEEKNKQLLSSIKEAEEVNTVLLNKIQLLEERISEINNGRFGKLSHLLRKTRFILLSPTTGRSFFSKVSFFFSPIGKKLFLKFLSIFFVFFKTAFSKKSPPELSKEVLDQNLERLEKPQKDSFTYRPLITLILIVKDFRSEDFSRLLSSIKSQTYENLECIITTNQSSYIKISEFLSQSNASNSIKFSIKVFSNQFEIADLANEALKVAQGKYFQLLFENAFLSVDALYQYVKLLNLDGDCDIIYSDEDTFNNGKFEEPNFKPDFCPANLLSNNYIGNSLLVNHDFAHKLNFFQKSYGRRFIYDFLLRASEESDSISHIDKVLFHSNKNVNNSIINHINDLRILKNAIKRRGVNAKIHVTGLNTFSVRYEIKDPKKVSIIIPTKDKSKVLKNCLQSIFSRSTYSDFEVILVDNNSEEEATFKLIQKYKSAYPDRFFSYKYEGNFNFARINNFGVTKAKGDYLIFLNNDTEIITPDWIQAMMEYSQKSEIGAVGAKLLYPNGKVQHAGMVIGLEYGGNTFVGEDKLSSGYQNNLNLIRNYSAVTAACMMITKQKFLEIGGFDEIFAVEYNDSDLCLRLKENGFNNIFLPHVELFHYESLSRGYCYLTEAGQKLHEKEQGMFYERWKRYYEKDPCYNNNLSKNKGGFLISR